MATSFICERSAELVLVPHMKSLLNQEFKHVVSIFPWLNRELGNKSKDTHKNDKFKILVLFPRRPKLSNGGIFVSINYELKEVEKIGVNYGIKVIAGSPIASDFWELSTCNEVVWINIGHPDTYEYLVPINSPYRAQDNFMLSDQEVLNSIKQSSYQTMETLENFIRETRKVQPNKMFGGQYKPTYFLIK